MAGEGVFACLGPCSAPHPVVLPRSGVGCMRTGAIVALVTDEPCRATCGACAGAWRESRVASRSSTCHGISSDGTCRTRPIRCPGPAPVRLPGRPPINPPRRASVMTDNDLLPGPMDRNRVERVEDHELRFWTREFRCSTEHLLDGVRSRKAVNVARRHPSSAGHRIALRDARHKPRRGLRRSPGMRVPARSPEALASTGPCRRRKRRGQ